MLSIISLGSASLSSGLVLHLYDFISGTLFLLVLGVAFCGLFMLLFLGGFLCVILDGLCNWGIRNLVLFLGCVFYWL